MIATLILAAGRGERMGRLKQLLPWGRNVLLGQTISIYRQAGAGPVLVVVGHAKERIMAQLAGLDVIWVENKAYGQGMSSSLKAGVQALPEEAEAVLLALGDMPLIKTETVRHITRVFYERRSSIIVPTFQGRSGHPVLMAKELFPRLLNVSADVGARQVIRDNPHLVCYLPVEDPGILIDVDEPEAYEKLRPEEEDVADVGLD
ncbi:MAG TPA: nucleotidyltransferase family protein [Clostridia bacterium]|nr:nucleotidyltransferase family protein [Clostridia bacterium]